MKIADSMVSNKLDAVQDTFQKGFDFAADISSLSSLASKLDTLDKEFLSIAYEGASMNIALNCFEAGDEIKPWFEFLESAERAHGIQYHIGLGWALAQLQLNTTIYLQLLDPIERYRVLDGYGYYEAMFRTKKSILNQLRPEGLNEGGISAYYQGIGRGIWYLSRGELAEVQNMMDRFQKEKRPTYGADWV